MSFLDLTDEEFEIIATPERARDLLKKHFMPLRFPHTPATNQRLIDSLEDEHTFPVRGGFQAGERKGLLSFRARKKERSAYGPS